MKNEWTNMTLHDNNYYPFGYNPDGWKEYNTYQ
jgi:hypothetical protein